MEKNEKYNFKKYINYSDILIIIAWVIFAFIIILELDDNIIRTILGIPMVLFIPGYVLIAALFPKKGDLELIERIGLSFGLSVAVVSLLGLLLNFTIYGIRLIPVLTLLCIYDIAFICIAIYRRSKSGEDGFSVDFNTIIKNQTQNTTERIILISATALAVGMIFYVITIPKTEDKFTEFYILGEFGKAENYHSELKVNSPVDFNIGVVNHEYGRVNYTVQVVIDKNILKSQDLTLDNNQTWEKTLNFAPRTEGNNTKLEFLLFKENNFTIPFRELHLWVNITKQ